MNIERIAFLAVRDVQRKILDGYKRGWDTKKLMKSLRYEDADLVGEVWSDLKKKGKLPKTDKLCLIH